MFYDIVEKYIAKRSMKKVVLKLDILAQIKKYKL